jgi:hypothetical protein
MDPIEAWSPFDGGHEIKIYKTKQQHNNLILYTDTRNTASLPFYWYFFLLFKQPLPEEQWQWNMTVFDTFSKIQMRTNIWTIILQNKHRQNKMDGYKSTIISMSFHRFCFFFPFRIQISPFVVHTHFI